MAESLRDYRGIVHVNLTNCAYCGTDSSLKVCSRCKSVAYCSKDHQSADWSSHKVACRKWCKKKKEASDTDDMGLMTESVSKLAIVKENREADVNTIHVTSDNKHVKDPEGGLEILAHNNEEEKDINTETKEENRVGDSCEDTHIGVGHSGSDSSNGGDVIPTGSSEEYILGTEESSIQAPNYTADNNSNMPVITNSPNSTYFSVVESRNKVLSDYVKKCLNAYGLCVIDSFLGEAKGTDILNEVMELHNRGELSSGELVNSLSPKDAVRGDVITWVDGSENGCSNINFLISSIDAIVLNCQSSLGHYNIKGRSKAMVAVYPEKSKGFLRHVDNPSGDGRCVTCIYYLNKRWNSKVDGGLLRIFPEGQSRVANVEPKFDRIIFFWSDRRNPHEVLPAFRTRYAVTVWYYDSDERRRAVKRFKAGKSKEPKREVVPLSKGNKNQP